MNSVTRRFEFDAAHRLLNYEGKCRFLHGHHYVLDVTFSGTILDRIGMLVDFGDIKRDIGGWLYTNWDHNILLNVEDPLVKLITFEINGRTPCIMNVNPTAENMLIALRDEIRGFDAWYLEAPDITLSHLRLYETPSCWADLPC